MPKTQQEIRLIKDECDDALMKAELSEMKGSNKIRLIEGERILCLGQALG